MSTYWGYFCQDCQATSEAWFKHGQERLEQYYIIWQFINGKDFHWIEVAPMGGQWAVSEMNEFLVKHEGHTLCLINEYGETQGFSHNNANAGELRGKEKR